MSVAGPAPSPAAALIERQIARLERLADIGMEIAEAAGRRAAALADAPEQPAPACAPALAYARAARAVRLTLALQARLARDLAALGEAATRADAAEAARRRDRIHARVEQAIEAERPDGERLSEPEAEALSSNVWEQLTEADDEALLALPVDEAVARICADLGLSPAPYLAPFPRLVPAASAPAPEGPPQVRPPARSAPPDPPLRAVAAAAIAPPGRRAGAPLASANPAGAGARPDRPAGCGSPGSATGPPRSL